MIKKLVAISDTHGMHRKLHIPKCDLLIHAGDITNIGELSQLDDFNQWVKELNTPTIAIPGNHDKTLVDQAARDILTNCNLLLDSFTTFCGLKIYGAPWTPSFGRSYWAFNADRGPEIQGHWAHIPEDTDILITHGPPQGILDRVPGTPNPKGCHDLLKVVTRIKPRYHFFGHLHDNYGTRKIGSTTFVNATTCNEAYKPINLPMVIQIEVL